VDARIKSAHDGNVFNKKKTRLARASPANPRLFFAHPRSFDTVPLEAAR
jgi:hypothetical protein